MNLEDAQQSQLKKMSGCKGLSQKKKYYRPLSSVMVTKLQVLMVSPYLSSRSVGIFLRKISCILSTIST